MALPVTDKRTVFERTGELLPADVMNNGEEFGEQCQLILALWLVWLGEAQSHSRSGHFRDPPAENVRATCLPSFPCCLLLRLQSASPFVQRPSVSAGKHSRFDYGVTTA